MIPPGNRLVPGDSFNQPVIVRGGDWRAQSLNGIEHGSMFGLERADRFPEPTPVLAARTPSQLRGDLLRSREQVVEIARLDLLLHNPQPLVFQLRIEIGAVTRTVAKKPGPGGALRRPRRLHGNTRADHHNHPALCNVLLEILDQAHSAHLGRLYAWRYPYLVRSPAFADQTTVLTQATRTAASQ